MHTMRIVGHGIDLVETGRIEHMLAEHETRFLERCFTERERRYCDADSAAAGPSGGSDPLAAGVHRQRLQRLAGRFAAKEAVLKVLGTGWSGGIAWTDVEVVRLATGRPEVALHHEARRIADQMPIDQWWLSISHINTHAMASAIGVADDISTPLT